MALERFPLCTGNFTSLYLLPNIVFKELAVLASAGVTKLRLKSGAILAADNTAEPVPTFNISEIPFEL